MRHWNWFARKRKSNPRRSRSPRPALFGRTALVERLEERRMLVSSVPVYTVTNTLDDGSAGSLRYEVSQANETSGASEINFSPYITQSGPATITLQQGPITIDPTNGGSIDIEGPGQNLLTIDGNHASSIFYVNNYSGTTFIDGLTLTHGSGTNGSGGAILNYGSLTISDSTITDNTAQNGGGLYNDGPLTVVDTTISSNQAYGAGGGIYNIDAFATVRDSTISGNTAHTDGGGVFNWDYGTINVYASTIANDSAGGSGGGIASDLYEYYYSNYLYNYNFVYNPSYATLSDSTVSANSAGYGGGLYFSGDGYFTVGGSIVAGNSGLSSGNDGFDGGYYGGAFSSTGYNLIGTIESFPPASGDILDAQPGLAPLANNGGPTWTMAINASSRAFNGGNPNDTSTDQRGLPVYGGVRDIGAFELQPLSTAVSLNPSQSTVAYGTPISLTANVTSTMVNAANPSEGTVTFMEGGNLLGSAAVSSGTATLNNVVLPYGNNAITASYADTPGSLNYAPSSTTAQTNGLFSNLFNVDQSGGIAVDGAGDVFSVDTTQDDVVEFNATTRQVTTIAGTRGGAGFGGDGGPATSALLSSPSGVAVDSAGNIYIADTGNDRVRRIDHLTHLITTVAGTGTAGYNGDGGTATGAQLYSPEGLAVDSTGDLFIADTRNQRVREVNAAGNISTVAGSGSGGYNGDGMSATSAELLYPTDVALDSAGDIFIADSYTYRVREVNSVTHIISTVAGDGNVSYGGDGSNTGDGGPATAAIFSTVQSVAVDNAGDFYIADTVNDRIRKVAQGVINTVEEPEFSPQDVAVDSAGNLYSTEPGPVNSNFTRIVELATGASVAVTPGQTTLAVTPSPAAVTLGQTVTLTATVSSTLTPSEGSVTFYDGTTPLGTEPVSAGTATLAGLVFYAGDHSITASYTDAAGKYANSQTSAPSVAHVAQATITGSGSVTIGSPYTLSLSGSETFSSWTINWGDGSAPQTVAGTTYTATHVYSTAANYTIQATAADAEGTYTTTARTASSLLVGNLEQPTDVWSFDPITGNPTGKLVDGSGAYFGTSGAYIEDMTIGPDGLLYVAGGPFPGVFRFNAQTGALAGFPLGGSVSYGLYFAQAQQAMSVNFGPDGSLYEIGSNAVYLIDPIKQEVLKTFTNASVYNLWGATFGPDGNLYIASGGGIFRLNPATGNLTLFASAAGPVGVTFGPDGNLYAALYTSNEILKFDAHTGAEIGVFAQTGSFPERLQFGPDGNLYVARAFDSVEKYDGTTGAFLDTFVPDSEVDNAGSLSLTFVYTNFGAAGLPVTVNPPVTAPTNVAVSPNAGTFAGVTYTNSGKLTLTGTLGQTGETVDVFDTTSNTDLGDASVTGTAFSSSLSLAEGQHDLRVRAINGSVHADATINVLVDLTPPTGSSVTAVPQRATSLIFNVTVNPGTDPVSGGVASGISSYDIYVASASTSAPTTPLSAFTLWRNVPASNPTAAFTAQSNTIYAFHSIAHDKAGNLEVKAANVIESSTYVPDLSPPVTQINSDNYSTAGTFTLKFSATAPGGSGIQLFLVSVQIDGGQSQTIAQLPGGTPVNGVYSGQVLYQGLTDGNPHTYVFSVQSFNGIGFPGTVQTATVNQTFAVPTSLQATYFVVEKGLAERSYIRFLDVGFNEPVETMNPPPIVTLDQYPLAAIQANGANGLTNLTPNQINIPSGDIKFVTDYVIEIDFGAGGIGGQENLSNLLSHWTALTADDGYYRLLINANGANIEEDFYRLFGDVVGNASGGATTTGTNVGGNLIGIVSGADISAISAAVGQAGSLVNADINGAGTVTSNDRTVTLKSVGRAIVAGLHIDD